MTFLLQGSLPAGGFFVAFSALRQRYFMPDSRGILCLSSPEFFACQQLHSMPVSSGIVCLTPSASFA